MRESGGVVIAVFPLARNLAAILSVIALAACAGTPHDVIGIDGKTVSARNVPGAKMHRIFVATTREAADDPALMYSGGRGKLAFAAVDVFVPPAHEPGRIERADSLPPDPNKHFVAVDPQRFSNGAAFRSELNRALAALPPGKRNALVFVHGFNTSFDGALFRFAQFVHDTNYPGVPILFSWPSRAKSTDYLYDLNSALASRDELLETFTLVSGAGIERGDILAHSMGNILTVETLRQAALEGRFDRRGRLRYVVLASPDIDIDLFSHQIKRLPVESHEFFVLVSQDDKALALSRFLAGGVARVGGADIEALRGLGLTVVDLTEVRDAASTHTKFAQSPEIVRLIGQRLTSDATLDSSTVAPAGVRVFQGVVGTVLGVPAAVLTGTGNLLTGQQ